MNDDTFWILTFEFLLEIRNWEFEIYFLTFCCLEFQL
jgi:hypothetical protein